MDQIGKLRIPGRVPAIVLAIVAVCFVIVPIVSLPCSITGLTQARNARKYIFYYKLGEDRLVTVAYFTNIFAIIASGALLLLALAAAIVANTA